MNEPPRDELCLWCDEPLLPGEQRAPFGPEHYECGLRSIIGSLGHQLRQCSCYGGDKEDPPGLSRREAARAAARFYHLGLLPSGVWPPTVDQPNQEP